MYPSLPTDPSFRVRYNVLSASGLCPQYGHSSVQFLLSTDNGDADGFASFVVESVKAGLFAPWTVAVLDNAAIHKGKKGR